MAFLLLACLYTTVVSEQHKLGRVSTPDKSGDGLGRPPLQLGTFRPALLASAGCPLSREALAFTGLSRSELVTTPTDHRPPKATRKLFGSMSQWGGWGERPHRCHAISASRPHSRAESTRQQKQQGWAFGPDPTKAAFQPKNTGAGAEVKGAGVCSCASGLSSQPGQAATQEDGDHKRRLYRFIFPKPQETYKSSAVPGQPHGPDWFPPVA